VLFLDPTACLKCSD